MRKKRRSQKRHQARSSENDSASFLAAEFAAIKKPEITMKRSTAIFADGRGIPYQPPQIMQCASRTQKAASARKKLMNAYSSRSRELITSEPL